MATATQIPESLDVEMDCDAPGCEGKGYIEHQHLRIDPKHMKLHLKEHAYATGIGANCDCPRKLGPKTRGTCQRCKGTGIKTVRLSIPKPGNKVRVIDEDLLIKIFGDDLPEYPGIVYDVQTPDEHGLELRTGIGVRVSWDLTKDLKRIRAKEVNVWTFDLLELELI